MKISELKKTAATLYKTSHAFLLCFESAQIIKAKYAYDDGLFCLEFRCDILDSGVRNFSTSVRGGNCGEVINIFINNILRGVDKNLAALKDEERDDELKWKQWKEYNREYSRLSQIASLEMLKQILTSLCL